MGLWTQADALNRWLSGPAVLPRLQRLAILYGLLFLATTVAVSIVTPGLVYGSGGVIGADFLAFYTAGDMTLQGRAIEAYDFAAFDANERRNVAHFAKSFGGRIVNEVAVGKDLKVRIRMRFQNLK